MRDLTLLHPKLQQKVSELQALCAAADLPLLITETFRTVAEQDALYAQGRTKPGAVVTNAPGSTYSSMHQWGAAFDFCRNIKGREWDDSDGFFGKVAALAKKIGLAWGGDWTSPVDKPHLQMAEFSPDGTTAWLKKTYATPENFQKTWIIQKGGNIVNYDEFKKFMEKYEAERAGLGVNPNLAPAEFEQAKTVGLTDGTRPQAFATRQELAVVALRAAKKAAVK